MQKTSRERVILMGTNVLRIDTARSTHTQTPGGEFSSKCLLIHGSALRRRNAGQMTVSAQLITCSNAEPLRSDMRLTPNQPAHHAFQHQVLYASNGAQVGSEW
jgi:hypothetical protein